jgi:hypothetical protein
MCKIMLDVATTVTINQQQAGTYHRRHANCLAQQPNKRCGSGPSTRAAPVHHPLHADAAAHYPATAFILQFPQQLSPAQGPQR